MTIFVHKITLKLGKKQISQGKMLILHPNLKEHGAKNT